MRFLQLLMRQALIPSTTADCKAAKDGCPLKAVHMARSSSSTLELHNRCNSRPLLILFPPNKKQNMFIKRHKLRSTGTRLCQKHRGGQGYSTKTTKSRVPGKNKNNNSKQGDEIDGGRSFIAQLQSRMWMGIAGRPRKPTPCNTLPHTGCSPNGA